MKRKASIIFRTMAFLIILGMCVTGVQHVFSVREYSIYSIEKDFPSEEPGSLDGVYIGSSTVLYYFQPPLAWKDHGITVYSYAVVSMPAASLLYRVIEARKTQPDAVYIINLNCFKSMRLNPQTIHRSVDYMPWSLNKLKMMDTLLDHAGIEGPDRLEYYLPLIRFHSSWNELESADFTHSVSGMNGGYTYKYFLQTTADQTDSFHITEKRRELDEKRQEVLDQLLDYLEKENVKVLFVTVPQVMEQKGQEYVNEVEDIVQRRGFDCLDLMDADELYGIQRAADYYNPEHFNVHGSIKYTEFLSNYLIEKYGFTDKRGAEGFESWDIAAEKYGQRIDRWTLDLEREHRDRDYGLAAPKLYKPKIKNGSAVISWKASEGAEEYLIYRKSDKESDLYWEYTATVSGGELTFTDSSLEEGVSYTYTVVPCRREGGKVLYGQFSFKGITAAA